MLDLSIVIVNWNTSGLLRNCLSSVVHNVESLEYELIVVDNGSTDDSLKMIRTEYPHVQLIANNENLGFARANNQAIRVAKGHNILLLNSDTEVLGPAINQMVDFLNKHPETGIVGASLRNARGERQFCCDLALLRPWEVLYQRLINSVWPNNTITKRRRVAQWTYEAPFEVDWVSGAALMTRRLVIDQIGPLDESFFMYSEDVDWCYRARRAGWKIFHLPDASIYHLGAGSSQSQPGYNRCMIRKNRVKLYFKHYGPLAALGLRLLYCLPEDRFYFHL